MSVKVGRLCRFGIALTGAFVLLKGCGHSSAPSLDHPPAREEESPAREGTRTTPPQAQLRPPAHETFTVRLQYLQTTQSQDVLASKELLVGSHELGLRRLPPGTWQVSAKQTAPARMAYPVYVKSFEFNEGAALRTEMENWSKRGYEPAVTTLGRAVAGSDGTLHDNRKYWLAVKHCRSQSEADALKKKLQGEKVWAWTREEVATPAKGTVTFRSTLDKSVLNAETPVTLRSEGTLTLPDARKGFPPVEVPSPIEIIIDHTGATAFLGEIPMDEYLRGILPAEMYASWPLEALKAQAVAARSDIIVHAAGKHYFDGYDFCIDQHCRAFGGRALFDSRTDQAVAETLGMVLVQHDQRIVPTVFSSNCGGWTESNENVWDGQPEASLRGRPDDPSQGGRHGAASVDRLLNGSSGAYCSGDKDYFRWERSISLAKLSAQFNRDYGIGNLKSIEALERGVSGRLRSIRLVGDRKSAVVNKELNIRRAFENLPSALCTFSIKKGTVYVRGAGRGHGVGLCQHGANGMARQNFQCEEILQHYFSECVITRL